MIRVILRITLAFFAIICLIGGCSLIISNLNILSTVELTETKEHLFTTNIIIIIVAVIGLILSTASILLIEIKGLKVYEKIMESVNLADKSINSLSKLSFPANDELGNLGQKIKYIIDVMSSFDELKKQIINRQNFELDFVINNYPQPVVMINHSYDIIKINNVFKDKFGVTNLTTKNIFDYISLIDHNLKAEIDAYEKQNFSTKLIINNEIHNTRVNFKRFYKENGMYDYIIFFNNLEREHEKELEIKSDNKDNDDVRFEVTENNDEISKEEDLS